MTDLSGVMIGLEIHTPLKTAAKLFCACPVPPKDETPNTVVCETCLGQPGSKPMPPSRRALECGLTLALALQCKVEPSVTMLRKHYFYPDLPSGYQRTSTPLAVEGVLEGVRIREVHIEEDPGRFDLASGQVDYNRSGSPLAEIVTEPDIKSPAQARRFLDSLQAVFSYLDAARPEPGSMRCDANISLPGGQRVEVKNINSFRGVERALLYEISRQRALLGQGLSITHETRHYDEKGELTVSMRKKEQAADYRYMPDPDLPTLTINPAFIDEVRAKLPELPAQRRARFETQYALTPEEAYSITLDPRFSDAFEAVVKATGAAKIAGRFMAVYVPKQLNWRSLEWKDSTLDAALVGEIVAMVRDGKVTEKVGEQALIAFMDKGERPEAYAKAQGLEGVLTPQQLDAMVADVLQGNPDAVASFKAGNAKAVDFLAGCVLKQARKRADPRTAREAVAAALAKA